MKSYKHNMLYNINFTLERLRTWLQIAVGRERESVCERVHLRCVREIDQP